MGLTVRKSAGVCELHLDAPPGNIVDRKLCLELAATIRAESCDPGLKAFLLTAAGKNFSYGASVPEHLPGEVERFMPAFLDIFEALMDSAVPAVTAVQGRCLGGGFELAAFGQFLVADRSAVFALPEIRLGVFPPLACAAFPAILGWRLTERLVLGGGELAADEANRLGLLARLVEPGELEPATQRLLEESILPHSAAALRQTTQALRGSLNAHIRRRLPALERRYLVDLMSTRDAEEGIRAFLEKRPPTWANA